MRHKRKHPRSTIAAPVLPAPETTPAERAEIVLAIGARRKRASVAAIAIEASIVEAWRRHAFGAAKSITPTRNEVYGRDMFNGHRSLAARDFSEGISDGGKIGRAAARAAADAIIFACDEADKKAAAEESRDAAIADFARESSDVSIARLNNKSDAELTREVDEAIASAKKLKAVIAAKRRSR